MNLTNILPVALFIANMMSFSIIVVTGSSSSSSICGDPNDACMANYADCEKLLQDGCIEIAILESCPLQFRCRKQSSSMTISKKNPVYTVIIVLLISASIILSLYVIWLKRELAAVTMLRLFGMSAPLLSEPPEDNIDDSEQRDQVVVELNNLPSKDGKPLVVDF
uniref:Uncharacterized protein n=1 Tax=Proboscia inermis TaxID=420281 RepID=A0A7S0GHB5_9STRA|mmetsp:Transcript_41562/g.42175  ORF Transcript_41562/g.42175 Transcript_41562/m.42175 type:complete len:165 (+) Transcript_41562:98-592(+)